MLANRMRMSGSKGQPLGNLNVGDKIKFGRYQVVSEDPQEIIWKIAAKNHVCTPAYPSNSVTLITEKIIDLRALDAKEPSNSDSNRQSYGNNRYSMSNLDQWLNKDSAAGTWYAAAHGADQAPSGSYVNNDTPYSAKAGFLNLFTVNEKNVIQNTTIRVVKPSIDGGSYEDITRKIYLPSTTEVGLANESDIAEGALWTYFSTASNRISYLTQQAFNNTLSVSKPATVGSPWEWWLRTPYASLSDTGRGVYNEGAINNTRAFYGFKGVRPALNLPSTLYISNEVDSDGCYVLV